jgi:hypothetical protein
MKKATNWTHLYQTKIYDICKIRSKYNKNNMKIQYFKSVFELFSLFPLQMHFFLEKNGYW